MELSLRVPFRTDFIREPPNPSTSVTDETIKAYSHSVPVRQYLQMYLKITLRRAIKEFALKRQINGVIIIGEVIASDAGAITESFRVYCPNGESTRSRREGILNPSPQRATQSFRA